MSTMYLSHDAVLNLKFNLLINVLVNSQQMQIAALSHLLNIACVPEEDVAKVQELRVLMEQQAQSLSFIASQTMLKQEDLEGVI